MGVPLVTQQPVTHPALLQHPTLYINKQLTSNPVQLYHTRLNTVQLKKVRLIKLTPQILIIISNIGITSNTHNTGDQGTGANTDTSTDNSISGKTKLAINSQTIALGVVIGLLALMELITAIGCILCFARKKWKTKTPPPQLTR